MTGERLALLRRDFLPDYTMQHRLRNITGQSDTCTRAVNAIFKRYDWRKPLNVEPDVPYEPEKDVVRPEEKDAYALIVARMRTVRIILLQKSSH